MKNILRTEAREADRRAFAVVLLTVWALYAVLSQLTPFMFDNVAFDAFYLGFNGGSDSFDVGALMRYAAFMRESDNWRLANIMAPLTTVVLDCKPVFALLTGLCMACMTLVPAAECGRGRLFVSAVAVWGAYTLFLPWRNNILTGDYALNYIYAGALTMLLLGLVFRLLRGRSAWAVAVVLPLSVVVAAWHEGFSVPTGAALLAYIVLWRRGRAPWSVWTCASVLFCGGLVWALVSALSGRAGVESAAPSILTALVKTVAFNCLTVALVPAVVVAALWPRLRCSLREAAGRPAFVVFALTAVAACVLSFAVKQSGRTAFWPQACAAAAWVLWMQQLWRGRRGRAASVVAAVVAVLLVAQGAYAAVYVKKAADEYHYALRAMAEAGEDATVYADITMPEAYPVATLGMPVRSALIEPFTYAVLDLRYPAQRAAIVPRALERAGREEPEELGEAMRLGDALFSIPDAGRLREDRALIATLDIRLADGSELWGHPAFALLFTAADGRRLQYLKPFNIAAREVAAVTKIGY